MSMLRCVLFLVWVLCAAPVWGQNIVIDWSEKRMTACPPEINKATNAKVVVKEVNDILYSYDVNVTEIARPIDDFRALMGIVPTLGGSGFVPNRPEPVTCKELNDRIKDEIITAKQALDKLLNAPCANSACNDGKKPKSIPLKQTIEDWNNNVHPSLEKLDRWVALLDKARDCDATQEEEKKKNKKDYDELQKIVKAIQAKSHQVEIKQALSPDHDYKISIKELFVVKPGQKPVVTEDGAYEFTCSPASNVLVLSAGALLTALEQRAYLSRKDPNSTNNVVAVEGTGMTRPIGVALLNYRLPYLDFGKGDLIGLSLSSGLTFELGATKSETSKLGWFGGVSLNFYHRFYITPGVHYGQFADFPVGFGKGSPIPPNFGELNPVKRWTGHFAVAVTYRTTAVSKTSDSAGSKK